MPNAESSWAASSSDRFGQHVVDVMMRPMSAPASKASPVPASVLARYNWSRENRLKVEAEQMDKEERTRMKQQRAAALHHKVQQERARAAGRDRAAVEACKQAKWMTSQVDRFGLLQDIDHTRQKTKQQIDHKVRMAKQTSAGRIAAARAMLLEKNKQARREEAEKQQFALNEKARRLAVMQQEHAKQLSRKFVMAPTDFEASQQVRLINGQIHSVPRIPRIDTLRSHPPGCRLC